MKKNVLGMVLSILMFLPSVAQATLADDGYHFRDYEDKPNVADYKEWWYFNFYQVDVQGFINYVLLDPANLTDMHLGSITANVFRNGDLLRIACPFPWEQIITSESSADLTMGDNTIAVFGDVYVIQGSVADLKGNTIVWDLTYVQDSASIYPLRSVKVNPEDENEEINWYVQMPSATVSGVLTINDVPLLIDARGYHDHNWGAWKPYHDFWNWFQTNEAGLAIVGIDLYKLNQGEIVVLVRDVEVKFRKGEYFWVNYDWVFSYQARAYFPRKTVVVAFNGRCFLLLRITVASTELIQSVYRDPPLLRTLFESTARFTGKLSGNRFTKKIDAVGFREYMVNVRVS